MISRTSWSSTLCSGKMAAEGSIYGLSPEASVPALVALYHRRFRYRQWEHYCAGYLTELYPTLDEMRIVSANFALNCSMKIYSSHDALAVYRSCQRMIPWMPRSRTPQWMMPWAPWWSSSQRRSVTCKLMELRVQYSILSHLQSAIKWMPCDCSSRIRASYEAQIQNSKYLRTIILCRTKVCIPI